MIGTRCARVVHYLPLLTGFGVILAVACSGNVEPNRVPNARTGGAAGTGGSDSDAGDTGDTGGTSGDTGGTSGDTGGTSGDTGGTGTGGWATTGGSTGTGGTQAGFCGGAEHIGQYDTFTQGIVLTFEPPSGQTLNMGYMPNNNEDWVGGLYGYVDGTCTCASGCTCTAFTVEPVESAVTTCPCGNINVAAGQGVDKAGAPDGGNAMKYTLVVREWGGGWGIWMECFDVTKVPYAGITFWAKRASATPFGIEASLGIPETTLATESGTCTITNEWGGAACSFSVNGDAIAQLKAVPETWTQFKLPFSAFVKKNIPGEPSLDKIKTFQIQVNNPSYGNQFTGELLIDNWGFYKD